MTAKEFIEQNKDILLRPLTEAAFHSLTDGTVLFCITTTNGSKPTLHRAVKHTGYQLVVATTREMDETMAMLSVRTLALTEGGYAKIDEICPANFSGAVSNKLWFFCKPLPINDPRQNGRFPY